MRKHKLLSCFGGLCVIETYNAHTASVHYVQVTDTVIDSHVQSVIPVMTVSSRVHAAKYNDNDLFAPRRIFVYTIHGRANQLNILRHVMLLRYVMVLPYNVVYTIYIYETLVYKHV